jgi:O-antigen/teichoic acid export membrane protein
MIGSRGTSSVSRKVLSGSVLGTANLVASAVVSLCLMPFIVHHLGDRIYGFWSLAAAFIGYYGLLDFGLSSAVSQYICTALGREDPVECREVFNAALRIQTLFGGIALVVTALIAGAAPWLCRNPADAHLFWRVIVILGVNAAIGFPTRVYTALLDAELRFDIQSVLGFLGLALRTGLTVWAILSGGGLLALAWVTLIATLPVTVLQIWFARREARWARIDTGSIARARAKSLFSYSVYTFATQIANALRFQIDPVVISAFVGLAAVTHYRVASAFCGLYVNIIIAAIGTFGPVFSRLHGAGSRKSLEKAFFFATKVSVLISVFICFVLIVWGRPFIAVWMGPKYSDAYWPLVVLSLAIFLDVSQNPSITLLYATFKHRSYTYVNVVEGIINVVVSLILAKPLGILGVALGTLIAAALIRIVVQPLLVCRATDLHYGFYMKFLGGNLLRSAGLAITAVALSAWGLRPSYPYLICSAICATTMYVAGCWFTSFTKREREQLLAAVMTRNPKSIEPEALGTLVS